MAFLSKQIYSPVIVIVWVILLNLNLGFAHTSGSCGSEFREDHCPSHARHHCDHGIGHHRRDHHQHARQMVWKKKLPEELAEEKHLKLLRFGSHHQDHDHQDYSDLGLTGFGLWIHAIGCSLLGKGRHQSQLLTLWLYLGSTTTSTGEEKPNVDAANGSTYSVKSTVEKEPVQSSSSLVFGCLNLFSDGVALLLGQDPGQSSLIEGFTAGGFIYTAVAGVLAEMNNGSSALKIFHGYWTRQKLDAENVMKDLIDGKRRTSSTSVVLFFAQIFFKLTA